MTRKKALIVGISDYGGKLQRLDSPEREIEDWRDLLMEEYGFSCSDIRLLANERARRDEIIHRLKWLFEDAGSGHQRLFIFAGHGVRLQKRDHDSGEILDGLDEALVAYPSAPTDDLETMAIYDDELFELYASYKGASEASVTFILDCCHGGGFNGDDMPRQPRVMSVGVPVDLRHRSLQTASRNDAGAYRKSTRNGTRLPVILNAAGELNLSVELEIDGDRRSLFSYHTLKELRANPGLTYDELLDKIRIPIEEHYPQHANLRGNQARRSNPFLQ
jgi:hypothetical protein